MKTKKITKQKYDELVEEINKMILNNEEYLAAGGCVVIDDELDPYIILYENLSTYERIYGCRIITVPEDIEISDDDQDPNIGYKDLITYVLREIFDEIE